MGINYIAKQEAKNRLDILVKPQKSLGVLEDIAVKMAGITGNIYNNIDKRVVAIFSSDNGIWEENVASAPQTVTSMQTLNFLKGITGIPVIAKANDCDIKVYNMGIKYDIEHQNLINRVIRKGGTSNMLKEDAMTYEEAIKAIKEGINIVKELKDEGYQIIGTGEMGIGNTSTSSCIISAITGCTIDEVTGRGGGLTEEQFKHKKNVLKQVILNRKPDKDDIIGIIHKMGGFDIATMTGVHLGSKKYRIPVVIDGFISMTAALAAYKIDSETKEYMFASHNSCEVGFKYALNEIGLTPMLNLNMRLGEGSGCPIAMSIIKTALAIINNMGTFEEGNIDINNYSNMWDGVEK